MYEITLNLSWFPVWMMWTVGGIVYVSVGIAISCLFKAREDVQQQLYENGCGLECCPGHKCGRQYQQSTHHCTGDNLTTDHKVSYEVCEIAKAVSIPLWPVVLMIGAFWKFCCVIKDLWCHSAKYALKNRQIRG